MNEETQFIVDLLEATYEDIYAKSWQLAKRKAANRYKEENMSKVPVDLLVSLARARKYSGRGSPRVVSLEELLG